jgi:hypothetical protein
MVLIMIINSGVVFVTSDSLIQPMDIIHLRVPYNSLAHLMMRHLVDCSIEALKARPMVTYFAREMLRHLVRLIEAPMAREMLRHLVRLIEAPIAR